MTAIFQNYCGSGRIRTSDPVSRIPVFKTGAFNHSATLPMFYSYYILSLFESFVAFLKILSCTYTMTKNPFLNALSATLYIAVVSLLMFYGSKMANGEDTALAPIGMISLLTLSVAIMGFLFFYQPFQMYFAGDKKEALSLFLKTLVIFACITAIIFLTLLFGGLK